MVICFYCRWFNFVASRCILTFLLASNHFSRLQHLIYISRPNKDEQESISSYRLSNNVNIVTTFFGFHFHFSNKEKIWEVMSRFI